MGKKAIVSKHIVLCTQSIYYPEPIYGIILIEDEIIHDIIHIDQEIPPQFIVDKYKDWNPQDYSNYYISPGLIDLNVRKEWETYSELTQSAIEGGVTLLLEEKGIYDQQNDFSPLYADIGLLATIDITNLESISDAASKGCLAFKGYLFPPSSQIQCVPSNLEAILSQIHEKNVPLFIDPNLPNPRHLFMASPLRFEKFSERNNAEYINSTRVFAAAFPDAIESEEEDSEEEPITTRPKRHTHYKKITIHPQRNFGRSNSIEYACEEGSEGNSMADMKYAKRNSYTDIYTDLEKRILAAQQNIEQLSIAEQLTYSDSGKTVREVSLPVPDDQSSSPENSLFERRLAKKRPSKLKITNDTKLENSSVYLYHVANYSESWETVGMKKVYSGLKKSQCCDVHIQNISAAQTFAFIRKIRCKLKDLNIPVSLTCEVPASHLYFDSSSIPDKDTRFKNLSPIRSSSNQKNLIELLLTKTIDCISSQHACIHPDYKNLESGNLQKALNGMNTLGMTLQATWSSLGTSKTFEHYFVRLAKWMSLHPAKVLKLQDLRGSIDKGKYADLVIWDPRETSKVSKCFGGFPELCPFLDSQVTGAVKSVYLRGELVYENNRFLTPTGKRVTKL